MTDTVTRLMGLIEAYRTAGGREEHWARKDALEAELTRLFTPLSDEQLQEGVRAWFKNPIVPGRYPFLKRMRAAINAAHGIGGES